MGKAVCRIGDADVTHCTGMTRAQGSTNVFVNGIGVSRQGDSNTPHLKPPFPPPIPCPMNWNFVGKKLFLSKIHSIDSATLCKTFQ